MIFCNKQCEANHVVSINGMNIKAKMLEISSDTHQLQLIKLHHFKLERFKSI